MKFSDGIMGFVVPIFDNSDVHIFSIFANFQNKNFIRKKSHFRDFPVGPVAKIPHSQCRRPVFNPWSGPYTATKSSHVTIKHPACSN